jgi:hypothetical protein
MTTVELLLSRYDCPLLLSTLILFRVTLDANTITGAVDIITFRGIWKYFYCWCIFCQRYLLMIAVDMTTVQCCCWHQYHWCSLLMFTADGYRWRYHHYCYSWHYHICYCCWYGWLNVLDKKSNSQLKSKGILFWHINCPEEYIATKILWTLIQSLVLLIS